MTYTVVEYEPEEFIFKQGDAGELMYLVQDGEVEVLQELAGHENQIAVLERGDFFGEMSILDDAPRSHSVRALSPTKLVKIDRSGFRSLLLRNAEVGVRMIRKLGMRLRTAEDMLNRAYAAVEGEATMMTPIELARRARLISMSDGSELEVPDGVELHIGRRDPVNQIFPDVDLSRADGQLTTSRRHARLLRRADGFFLQEERATNGTFVNGQRISTERPIEIRTGDEVMFGTVRMRFLID